MPASDNVQVQVIDGLPAILAGVNDDAEPIRSMLFSDLSSAMKQMAQRFRVSLLYVRQRWNFTLRDDQDVHGSDRRDVVKGQANIVLKNFVAGNFTGKDTTEDGGCGHTGSVLNRVRA